MEQEEFRNSLNYKSEQTISEYSNGNIDIYKNYDDGYGTKQNIHESKGPGFEFSCTSTDEIKNNQFIECKTDRKWVSKPKEDNPDEHDQIELEWSE